MNKFDHKQNEQKWTQKWSETGVYDTPEIKDADAEKMYILDMFPYPSGAGLHVGHVEGYTATDILSRYNRMKGKHVMHPMGWDAFGLPSENYAIKTGIAPRINTDTAIETFTKQMNAVGLSYDWKREIGSHTEEYYKWTQWFFLFLYKKGLAYKKEAPVNWCESCKTSLANEQVIDGKCERCDNEVMQKNMNQWFFKITDYADRLIDGLKKVDWPESTKINQTNWIGRSEGAEVEFQIKNEELKVKIFTTRLDTIFGATFMVISPEHSLIKEITTNEYKHAVENYQNNAKKMTELERTSQKEKTGVFTGSYAVNPYNGKEIPIWVGDFVIATYGTGALMAVPAHDDRDFEFATKFGLNIIPVIDNGIEKLPSHEYGKLINSDEYNGLSSHDAFEKMITKAEKESFGNRKVNYKLRDWLVSRQRYWGCPIPVVYDPEGKPHLVEEKDLPVILPDDVEFLPTGESPLKYHKEFHRRVEEKYGKGWSPEVDTMDTFVDSSWYFLRFADTNNEKEFASKEKMDKWAPVDVYVGGAEHTVLHLMYSRFFTKVLFDNGFVNFDEPFMKLRHQGMILGEDSRKMSKRWGNVINPLDVVDQLGADTLRMYEMFMGPFDQMKPWSTTTIQGVRRFIDRVWNIITGENFIIADKDSIQKVEIELNKLIKKIGEDIEAFKFNTAVSEFMKFINFIEDQKMTKDQVNRFLLTIAPFAPFVAEELWFNINKFDGEFTKSNSIHSQKWPSFDSNLVQDLTVVIGVQINGKVRGEIEINIDDSDEVVKDKAITNENVAKWLESKEIKKFIYVKGKIVNIVI
ncbi:MAG: leucine--tRNA ligase [bacterium]